MTEHEIEIRVRYQETDGQGVLHHANYFTYFELGRTELLRAMGHNYRDVEERGILMVVVDIGCRYRRPARYDDQLRLQTRVRRVTAAKIEHEYTLRRGEEVIAEGHSTIACIDRSGTVVRVPDWIRTTAPRAETLEGN